MANAILLHTRQLRQPAPHPRHDAPERHDAIGPNNSRQARRGLLLFSGGRRGNPGRSRCNERRPAAHRRCGQCGIRSAWPEYSDRRRDKSGSISEYAPGPPAGHSWNGREQENDEGQMRLLAQVEFHAGTLISPQSFVNGRSCNYQKEAPKNRAELAEDGCDKKKYCKCLWVA